MTSLADTFGDNSLHSQDGVFRGRVDTCMAVLEKSFRDEGFEIKVEPTGYWNVRLLSLGKANQLQRFKVQMEVNRFWPDHSFGVHVTTLRPWNKLDTREKFVITDTGFGPTDKDDPVDMSKIAQHLARELGRAPVVSQGVKSSEMHLRHAGS